MIGRIAFWLLLPGLIATVVELAVVLYVATGPQAYEYPDRLGPLVIFVFLFVLLVSMTIQALVIVRRPRSLTTRQLPTRIAVVQFVLYVLVALWVSLLTRADIGGFSVAFAVVTVVLSIMLLVLIVSWRHDPSERATEVVLPTALRVVLWAYCLIALVGLMIAVASFVNPTLDPSSGIAFTVLTVLGLPLALLTIPVAVIGALVGYTVDFVGLSVLPVLANMAAVLLVLTPITRVRLVNWFFRLGATPKPDLDTIAEDA